jgi:hypothetical protein
VERVIMEPVKVPMPRQAKYEEEQEHMKDHMLEMRRTDSFLRRINRIDGKSQDVRREY